jgi:tetratricopeptide (TPR) repeat protein
MNFGFHFPRWQDVRSHVTQLRASAATHISNRTAVLLFLSAFLGTGVFYGIAHIQSLWSPSWQLLFSILRPLLTAISAVVSLLLFVFVKNTHPSGAIRALAVTSCVFPLLIAFVTPMPHISEDDLSSLRHDLFSTSRGPADSTPEARAIAKAMKLSRVDPLTAAEGKLALGNFQEAINLLDQGIAGEERRLAEAHYFKARSFWALGQFAASPEESQRQFASARQEADRSLSLMPDFAPALAVKCASLRSLAQSDQGLLANALQTCDDALRADPKNQKAWNNKGNVLIKLGRYEDAVAAFDIAIQCDPPVAAQPWNNKAVALHKLGRDNEALTAVNQSLQLAPDSEDASLNKGTILKKLGRLHDAVALYEEVAKTHPNDVDVWNNLGDADETSGNASEALPAYNAALQLDPHFQTSLFNKGSLLTTLGKYGEAEPLLSEACRLDPKDSEACFYCALSLSKTGRAKEALAVVREVLRSQPTYAPALKLQKELASNSPRQ